MILNDSTYSVLEDNVNVFVTENDGDNFNDYVPAFEGYWNNKSVWMVSREKIWLGTQQGKILNTSDGGITWQISYDFQDFNYSIYDIYFADSLHGWAIVNREIIPDEQYVLRTNNGGQSWDITHLQDDIRLVGMTFTDLLHGWICDYEGQVHYTVDGGQSWNTVMVSPGEDFRDIHFIDNQIGFVFRDNYYKTNDGGVSWQIQNEPSFNYFQSGYFATEIKGWALRSNNGIWHTTDGGLNWIQQFNPVDYALIFMEFYDENYGIVASYDHTRSFVTLFKTYNGGVNWIEESNKTSPL